MSHYLRRRPLGHWGRGSFPDSKKPPKPPLTAHRLSKDSGTAYPRNGALRPTHARTWSRCHTNGRPPGADPAAALPIATAVHRACCKKSGAAAHASVVCRFGTRNPAPDRALFSRMMSTRCPAGLFIAFKEPSRGIALARRRHFPDNPAVQEAKIG